MKKSQNQLPPYNEQSEQSQPSGEEEQQQQNDSANSDFEQKNKIYELKSKIHSLSIQKEQQSIQYQKKLQQQYLKLQHASAFNEQLMRENKILNSENVQLRENLNSIAYENQGLKRQIENLKNQLDSFVQHNKKPLSYKWQNQTNSQIIKQLQQKQDIIRNLQREIERSRDQKFIPPNSELIMQLKNKKQQQTRQIAKLKSELDEAQQKIQSIKKSDLDAKRQYDTMLQSKQQIIKKITTQNQDHTRNLLISKDKIIAQMRKETQQLVEVLNEKKQQIKIINEKNYNIEKEINRIKRQMKKKQDQMLHQFEVQKQELIKIYNDKIKNFLKDREDKMQNLELQRYQSENQLNNVRSEILKLKTQLSSTVQLNEYLENVNKQNEYAKKKLTQTLTQREKQICEIRQDSFNEMNEMKKTISGLKKQIQEQLHNNDQEILEKNIQIQKLQKRLKNLQHNDNKLNDAISTNIHKNLEALKGQNNQLRQALNRVTKKFQEKCERSQQNQLNLKKQYEERLLALEMQLKQEKIKHIEIKAIQKNMQQQFREELQKIKTSKEILQLQKNAKIQQVKRIKQRLDDVEVQYKNSEQNCRKYEKQLHSKRQQYHELQRIYEELQNKSKATIRQLQTKLQDTSDALKNEKKKIEKRRNQLKFQEEKWNSQVKKLRQVNEQLFDQLQYLKANQANGENLEDKINKLAQEVTLMKQRQNKMKNSEQIFKKQIRQKDQEIRGMNQIIGELQEKFKLLSNQKQEKKRNKYDVSQVKNNKQFEHQNLKLRIQYSQTLKQLNVLLQKFRTLQQKHRECSAREDFLRNQLDRLHQKYLQVCNDKNKAIIEYDNACQQIDKLNTVLMGKQQQIVSFKKMKQNIYEPVKQYDFQNRSNALNYSKSQNSGSLHNNSQRNFLK